MISRNARTFNIDIAELVLPSDAVRDRATIQRMIAAKLAHKLSRQPHDARLDTQQNISLDTRSTIDAIVDRVQRDCSGRR